MENCVCSELIIRTIREAFSNLVSTTGSVMRANTMSLTDSGIGSTQTFSNPSMNNSPTSLFSNLNILLVAMTLLLAASLIMRRNKAKTSCN